MKHFGAIELTEEERKLLASITLEDNNLDYDANKLNGVKIPMLLELLSNRNAIPSQRMRYFDDPSFTHQGRVKGSFKQHFERNGTTEPNIFKHHNFRKFLRYILFGPELPKVVSQNFSAEIERCGQVNGTDALALAKIARNLVRQHELLPYETSEEFLKLCLDCGVGPSHAITIGQSIKLMR